MSEMTGPNELEQLLREAPPEETEGEHHGEDGEEAPPRRRKKKHAEHGITHLNLTAMMDMMTIILVFLLKNYATETNIQVSQDLSPPKSTAKKDLEAAVTITVTAKEILVGDKKVAELTPQGSVVGDNPKANNAPIDAVSTELSEKVANLKQIESKGGAPFDGKILIVADKNVPYQLLMRVLYTAGLAQFTQYKLVVRAGGGG